MMIVVLKISNGTVDFIHNAPKFSDRERDIERFLSKNYHLSEISWMVCEDQPLDECVSELEYKDLKS